MSKSAALRLLGLRPVGSNFATLGRLIEHYGISTAHFDPNWTRRGRPPARAIPLEEVLVERSSVSRAGKLKRRLYETGLKQRTCELCGQGETWQGATMALILDHINGVGDDNRLENLRIVCPNCAATLDTHCGRRSRIDRAPREPACTAAGRSFQSTPSSGTARSAAVSIRQGPRRPFPERRKVERAALRRRCSRRPSGWASAPSAGSYGVSDNAVRKWIRWYEARPRSGRTQREPVGPTAAAAVVPRLAPHVRRGRISRRGCAGRRHPCRGPGHPHAFGAAEAAASAVRAADHRLDDRRRPGGRCRADHRRRLARAAAGVRSSATRSSSSSRSGRWGPPTRCGRPPPASATPRRWWCSGATRRWSASSRCGGSSPSTRTRDRRGRSPRWCSRTRAATAGSCGRRTERSSGSRRPRPRATPQRSSCRSARSTRGCSPSTRRRWWPRSPRCGPTTPRASTTCPTCCRSCAPTSGRSTPTSWPIPTRCSVSTTGCQLAEVTAVAQRQIHARHMLAGVTIVNPAATVIDVDVEIAPDAVIAPFTSLHGQTRIGAGSTVGPAVDADRRNRGGGVARSSTPTSTGRSSAIG